MRVAVPYLVGSTVICFFCFSPAVLAQTCDPALTSGFGGPCTSVVLSEGLAFVAEGVYITVLDLSQPDSPEILSRVEAPFPPFAIDVSGNRLVIVGGVLESYLASFNIANSRDLVEEGIVALPHSPFDVSLDGERGCLAYGGSGLQLVDLSNPAEPMLRGLLDTPGQPFDVELKGNVVFVADSFSSLMAVDASNPDAPVPIRSYTLPGGGTPSQIALEGDRLSVLDYSFIFHLFDVSDPASAARIGGLEFEGTNFPGRLAAMGDRAIVSNTFSTLFLLDLSVPAMPVLSATETLLSNVRAIAVDNEVAAIAVNVSTRVDGDGFNGLEVFGLPSKGEIDRRRSYQTPQYPEFIRAESDHLHVIDKVAFNRWVLHLMDHSDPARPLTEGTIELTGEPYEIRRDGHLVYVAIYTTGVEIIDVSTPSSPAAVDFVDLPAGYINDMELTEDRLYVAAGTGGVQIFDRSNPTQPSFLGVWPDPFTPYTGYAESLVPAGSILYVADGEGLHVLDVSNPSNVAMIGSDPTFPRVLDLAVNGGFAYGALYEGQLQIADVSIPSNPTLRGGFDLGGPITSRTVDVLGGRVFLAATGVGLSIFDASEVDNPLPCGGFERTDVLLHSSVLGDTVYLSGENGVQLLILGCPGAHDVNDDGFVDARDLLGILTKITHPDSVPGREDVNCDGIVDPYDVVAFQSRWKTP